MTDRRANILLPWFSGVVAAAQLAKFTVLAPWLRAKFGLSLTEVGLLISLLEVGGAVFGFFAGLALSVISSRRLLVVGLALLAATSSVEAFADSAALMFLARTAEGIAYLLIVIGAPTLMVGLTHAGRERDRAMVLWSTFVPVGIGLGSVITGVAAEIFGPQGAILSWAAAGVIMLIAVLRLPSPPTTRRSFMIPSRGAWLLSASFGCYTMFLCAITGLLPTFLLDRHGADTATGSSVAGLVALSALPGSLLAMTAIRIARASPLRLMAIMAIALVAAALLAPFIYQARSLLGCAVLAGAVLLLAGVARTIIFTRLPQMSGASSPGDPRIASAQGLLTQFGAGGALLGPPLGAFVSRASSWSALGSFVDVFIILLLALMLGAERLGGTGQEKSS
jgi:CP family cyanate transporter-like MFS transporter